MRQSGGLGEEMAGAGAALAPKRPRVERHVCARGRRRRSSPQKAWGAVLEKALEFTDSLS